MSLFQEWQYSQKTRNELDRGEAPILADDIESLEAIVGELKDLRDHCKVPALEDYMANLAKEKGLRTVFNCKYVQITEKDLDNLESKVCLQSLNENASGLFWGKHFEGDYIDIQKAIDAVRIKLNQGHYVYYSSSW